MLGCFMQAANEMASPFGQLGRLTPLSGVFLAVEYHSPLGLYRALMLVVQAPRDSHYLAPFRSHPPDY